MTSFEGAFTLSSASIFDCQCLPFQRNLKVPSSQLSPVGLATLIGFQGSLLCVVPPILPFSLVILLTSLCLLLFRTTIITSLWSHMTSLPITFWLHWIHLNKNTNKNKSGFILHFHPCCRVWLKKKKSKNKTTHNYCSMQIQVRVY